MARHRMSADERHDHHHVLISERVAAWRVLPRLTSGLHPYRRREAYKKAAWTLRIHLNGEHGLRGGSLPVRETLDEMLARHEELHAGGALGPVERS